MSIICSHEGVLDPVRFYVGYCRLPSDGMRKRDPARGRDSARIVVRLSDAMANNLTLTCQPIGGRRLRALPLITTLLFFARADGAASFVPPRRPAAVAMSPSRSPPIGASAGAGGAPRAIHPGGGFFGLDDFEDDCDTTTSEIVDYGGGGAIDPSRSLDRNDRRLFLSSLFASSLPLGFVTPSPAFAAAKGAAEYDLEYYMRDLL